MDKSGGNLSRLSTISFANEVNLPQNKSLFSYLNQNVTEIKAIYTLESFANARDDVKRVRL